MKTKHARKGRKGIKFETQRYAERRIKQSDAF